MTRRGFATQLAVVVLATGAATMVESLAGAWLVRAQGAGAVLCFIVASIGLWTWPCLLGSALAAALLAALLEEEPLGHAGRRYWARPDTRPVLLVALMLVGPLLLWLFLAARRGSAFHNADLAAALVAFSAFAGLLVLALLGALLVRALRARPAWWRRALWGALALDLLSLTWLLSASWPGLLQLDARLAWAPLALVLGFVAGDFSRRVRGLGLRGLAVAFALALCCWTFLFVQGTPVTATLTAHGAWSPRLIAALQRLSDFDDDGYSGLLGGGDCAPFDPAVSPKAAEIAGDGVDNNCVGGDAGSDWRPRRPAWGAQVHGAPSGLHVVVITVETLRADHASFVFAQRDTTPELRKLAREALVFERMYSAAPLTRLALASLFSSYAPSEIDWQPQAEAKRMRRIGPETPWLPELLRQRGYDTLAVLTDFSAFTPQESAGFERGFRHYDTSTRLRYQGGTMWGFPAAEQVDKAIALLREARRPVFLWLHLFEPHYRYEQPPGAPRFGHDEQARYDAEIWHVDQQVGRLLSALKELQFWDDTVLFVSGDHGEAFGEHDDRFHGSNLFDPQLRPAALLRVPGLGGKRIREPATFTDVAPTLARILGDRASFERLRGRSLTPLLHGGRLPPGSDGFVAESFSVDDGHAYQAAWVDLPLKLIYTESGRSFSLFDLDADPREQRPLEPASDPRAAPLMRQLVGYLERARPASVAARR